jgi:hypothetical protein
MNFIHSGLIEPRFAFGWRLRAGGRKGGFAAAGPDGTHRFCGCQPRPCVLCSSRPSGIGPHEAGRKEMRGRS